MSERNPVKKRLTDAVVYGTKGAFIARETRETNRHLVSVMLVVRNGAPLGTAWRTVNEERRFIRSNLARTKRHLKLFGNDKELAFRTQVEKGLERQKPGSEIL